jgi:hypothetical protein
MWIDFSLALLALLPMLITRPALAAASARNRK